jgi:hypothetical protein
MSSVTATYSLIADTTASGSRCDTPLIRGTAFDANGRQIADALVWWSSADTSIAVVDSVGWVHASHCPVDASGILIDAPSTVSITATLKEFKSTGPIA